MSTFPSFYNPNQIGTLHYPDLATVAAAATATQFSSADQDSKPIHLLIIDMQIDFTHQQGALFVPGAQEDLRRLIEFIYANVDRISKISCTLDSHTQHQIFHHAWWADADGNHPAPFTLISAADVAACNWQPLRQPDWSRRYVQQLEAAGKQVLTIWPYHVGLGAIGNALDPALYTAVFYHSIARQVEPNFLMKGTLPASENYSIFGLEVPLPDAPQQGRNQTLLDELAAANQVIIAGEAESHCVLASVSDLVADFATRDGNPLRNVYLLQDATSSVQHPDIDFQTIARQRYTQFAEQGLNLATTETVQLG